MQSPSRKTALPAGGKDNGRASEPSERCVIEGFWRLPNRPEQLAPTAVNGSFRFKFSGYGGEARGHRRDDVDRIAVDRICKGQLARMQHEA